MRLDTHQHFWQLANPFTHWPTPDQAGIYRDYQPAALKDELDAAGIDGTILVQASPEFEESLYCLALADRTTFVRGVVAWIDFEAQDALHHLEQLTAHPKMRGLRPMVQSIDEPEWLLRPEFTPIFARMIATDLSLDGLVLSHQIGDLASLARRHPALRIVLDHGGKPRIADGEFDRWADGISNLAANANVHCKLSGLWTEAGSATSRDSIDRYVRHLLDAFGSERLMWGSDWPVLEQVGTYRDWLGGCEAMLSDLSELQRVAIFGENGRRFYGLD